MKNKILKIKIFDIDAIRKYCNKLFKKNSKRISENKLNFFFLKKKKKYQFSIVYKEQNE